jgi:hypothetical protein
MRLVEYIRSDHKKFDNRILDATINKLKKGYSEHYKFVSDMLIEMTDQDFESHWSRCFFYRGTHGPKIFERSVKQDRRPKDTHYKLHNWLDNEFQKKFGWRPRTQGLFATGDFGFANGYQNGAWIIFPSNGYKFIWSHKVSDIYKNLNFDAYEDPDVFPKYFRNEYEQLYGADPEHHEYDYPFKTFDEYVEDYENKWKKKIADELYYYQDTDLEGAMRSGNEVMFGCQKYFAINFDMYGLLFARRVREQEYK